MKKITASLILAAFILSLCACDDYEEIPDYGEDESKNSEEETDSSYDELFDLFGDDDSGAEISYEDGYDNYDYVEPSDENYGYDYSLGSAKELDGKIAVVSIFVNDKTTSWDFDDDNDRNIYNFVHQNLCIATDYLEEVSNEYGHHPEFIHDWLQYPEIFHMFTLNIDYQTAWKDYALINNSFWQEIDTNISESEIRQKTGADQVLYMAFFNTPIPNEIPSCTRNYYYGMSYPYEICYMCMSFQNHITAPSTFAHEMLHAFGAPDLYSAEKYGITQEYVDYVADIWLNDIMRICQDPETYEYLYDSIPNEITDITTYYAGLTDYSETVEAWGFEKSEHLVGKQPA